MEEGQYYCLKIVRFYRNTKDVIKLRGKCKLIEGVYVIEGYPEINFYFSNGRIQKINLIYMSIYRKNKTYWKDDSAGPGGYHDDKNRWCYIELYKPVHNYSFYLENTFLT